MGDGYGHQSTSCFFLPLSLSLESRKAKSQNFSAGIEGLKRSHLFMTRGPGNGALWKERVRKIYCFFFLSLSYPRQMSQSCTPMMVAAAMKAPETERKTLFSDQRNEKARGNPCYFFCLFPVAASPQSQSQSQEMHNSDRRLESHLSSLRPRPKGLESGGGVVKRIES